MQSKGLCETVEFSVTGASEAAKVFIETNLPQKVAYGLCTQEDIEQTKEEYRKRRLAKLTELEIRALLKKQLSTLKGEPIKLNFVVKKCADCGQVICNSYRDYNTTFQHDFRSVTRDSWKTDATGNGYGNTRKS